jgi:large subunit ribosomal protein L9
MADANSGWVNSTRPSGRTVAIPARSAGASASRSGPVTLPRGLAAPATDSNLQTLTHSREAAKQRDARVRQGVAALKERLEGLVVEVRARAGEEGRLFGSVTAQDIVNALAAKNFTIDRRKVQLEEPIKQLGEYKVSLRLHKEVTTEIVVNVVREE